MRTVAVSFAFLFCLIPTTLADEPAPMKDRPTNRLARQSSPYLLQHAHNPVQWYAWGEDAFAKAKKENKLIFLSIGYSSCHWCHVMERESFDDKEVAALLNKHFVPIKVDREERPDVDEVYMTALQVTGQSGGWPLSMFLTPEGKPIFGGTYWPKEDRQIEDQTVLGFKSVLQTVMKLHESREDELKQQADSLADATARVLRNSARPNALAKLERKLIDDAISEFVDALDPEYGGFGRLEANFKGTKFPMSAALDFVLVQGHQRNDASMTKLAHLTLEKMARGGIYDQLGGGFHRYSTERTWLVPHFEKMLYDNGQLVELYSQAHRLKPNPLYTRIVEQTLEFIDREMTSPDGAFYSALDADSEEKEGEFYVWTAEEIDTALTEEEAALFRSVYDITGNPNFEEEKFILTRPKEVTPSEVLTSAEAKLRKLREKRERPFLDTKVLTSWNGLMIAGYASAGQVFENPDYLQKAERAATFVLKHLRNDKGRLLRSYATTSDGRAEAKLNAYLDDYAFLIHGLLNLYDATNEQHWLDEATALAKTMIEFHYDTDVGGFYFTSHDHEKLFARGKIYFDGAEPSGNGVAVRSLLRLAKATGEKEFQTMAEKTLKAVAGSLKESPRSSPVMLASLDLFLTADEAPPRLDGGNDEGILRKSDKVVDATVQAGKPDPMGRRTLTLTLQIEEPYHIYANPVGAKLLEGVATKVTLFADGQPVEAQWTYPKGDKVEDENVGDYFVYEGKVTILATVSAEGPLEARITLQACTDRACLLPATIKVKVP